ncbi:Peptidyl-prolyl cis-trans isomerase D [Rubripirellula obstinata]|uniref:Periplasmic chaperone PpiD n=1 Tax=Rubripirellula obstinata TaxID=406547 RepID=A0A5B1CE81_9BACT|nr:peptidylprolyl isomerase [Rubripirellula obstinata]KAA1257900.1 Peptidyl-prolyl cis-trans isomerase D [Rubripirellula obstinata]
MIQSHSFTNAVYCFVALVASIALPTALRPTFAQLPPGMAEALAEAEKLPSDPAAVVAKVGEDSILLGDILPRVEARIAEVVAKNGQEIPEEQIKLARYSLSRPLLAEAIRNKMMRASFLNDQVGTENFDKRIEADKRLESKAIQMFYESELPQLKKQYKTNDLSELDKLLREKGNSFEGRQREFVDMMLGHLYIRSKVDRKPEVSISEIHQYYLDNQEEFSKPTRARWEQLSVMFSNYATREEAQKVIWEIGRAAFYGGNLQAIAKERSEEPFASKGGLHEWTAKDSLASEELNEQIFSIETNAMSEIIEDANGLHIVRVLEREEAGVTALSEVQDEIRAKIRAEKIAQSQRKVMEDMQERIPVWSLFPKDLPNALPLPESVARHHFGRSSGKKR